MAEMNFSDLFGREKREKKPREKKERREHDAYMTPAPLVEAIVERIRLYLPAVNDAKVIEPSCGDGEFVANLRAIGCSVVAVDIRPEVREKIEALGAKFVHHDYLTIPTNLLSEADLIITNPPYSLLSKFIEHSLEGMRNNATLALLQRFGHLVGSREAQAWWLKPLSNGLSPNRQIVDTLPVFPRPSFTGGGTDATEYCVAIFRKGFDNGGRFDPVTWEKPERRGRKPRNVGG